MGATDLEVVGAIIGINRPLIELLEDLLEKQIGEAFCDLFFLIAPSQTNRWPLVEGQSWGQSSPPHHLSPFELAAVSFCSRPNRGLKKPRGWNKTAGNSRKTVLKGVKCVKMESLLVASDYNLLSLGVS